MTRVERAFHHEEAALALELELLAARRLPVADHARVVRALAERDGVEAALASGEKALAYTRHADLLRALIELAEGGGQAERAATLRAMLQAETASPAAGAQTRPR